MKIEKISADADRAGRYYIRFADGSTLRLYRQTLEDFSLAPGTELTEAQFVQLQEAAGTMSAKMRAVRIVAASNVSRRDLEERLVRKGENPEQAKEAVQWMQELHLVDDEQTARQIVNRCAARGYGIARARQALYEKKIPKSCWDAALADYPDQSHFIASYLQQHLHPCADAKEIKRSVDALLRRGHNYSDIRRELNKLDVEKFQEE